MTFREQSFAELYRGYLSLTEAQITAINSSPAFDLSAGGVWPPADVPRHCPHDDAVADLPMITVVADEQPHKHWQIAKVEVFIRLKVQAQLMDGEESDGIDRAGTPYDTAQKWMQALVEAVYATETFRVYLLSLSAEVRTGGQMMQRTINQGIVHVHDADSRTHTFEISIQHDVDVSPP